MEESRGLSQVVNTVYGGVISEKKPLDVPPVCGSEGEVAVVRQELHTWLLRATFETFYLS